MVPLNQKYKKLYECSYLVNGEIMKIKSLKVYDLYSLYQTSSNIRVKQLRTVTSTLRKAIGLGLMVSRMG